MCFSNADASKTDGSKTDGSKAANAVGRAAEFQTQGDEFEAMASIEEWREFEDMVHKARIQDLPDIIDNLSSVHAPVILRELIAQAMATKRPLRIISGRLNPDCYDTLTKDIENFLETWSDDTRTALQVLLTDIPTTGAPSVFLEKIKSYKDGDRPKVAIKTTPKDAPHITVVGKHAYRFEANHNTMEAKASFNHNDLASDMVSYFDEVFEDSTIMP